MAWVQTGMSMQEGTVPRKDRIIACVLLIEHGGILAHQETGRFPGGPLSGSLSGLWQII